MVALEQPAMTLSSSSLLAIYAGVFEGGEGFDTLVFDFETPDNADGVTVDLNVGNGHVPGQPGFALQCLRW